MHAAKLREIHLPLFTPIVIFGYFATTLIFILIQRSLIYIANTDRGITLSNQASAVAKPLSVRCT